MAARARIIVYRCSFFIQAPVSLHESLLLLHNAIIYLSICSRLNSIKRINSDNKAACQRSAMDTVSPNASPLDSLKGGVCVITGGASGIGLAVAHAALERGLCVLLGLCPTVSARPTLNCISRSHVARPWHVAIGDIEQTALDAAVPELRVAAGAGLGNGWPSTCGCGCGDVEVTVTIHE